jgi:hypothetical protein
MEVMNMAPKVLAFDQLGFRNANITGIAAAPPQT